MPERERVRFARRSRTDVTNRVRAEAVPITNSTTLSSFRLSPTLDKIFGIGVNYKTHLAESGREQPKYPMIFLRFANSQVGHRQPIIRPNVSDQLDYEGELAVIIGERCRHVTAAESKHVVAGYSCYNDGSVRDWQRHTGQFTPGKNFPKTGGFGPSMVTPTKQVTSGARAW